MDNRVTKRRLSDLLSYEWIMMIVISALVILVWDLAYTTFAVRLSAGQQFKFFYDTTIYGEHSVMLDLFEKDKTFSYDVITVNSENLLSDFNVLGSRLSIKDGDVLITDCNEPADDAEDKSTQVKSMIDTHHGYSYEQMYKDAKEYLSGYMKDDVEDAFTVQGYSLDNIDVAKVSTKFRARMKKDNRFRKESEIINGIGDETKRIESLYQDVVKFGHLLSLKQTNPELFFIYTRYEQTMQSEGTQEDKDRRKEMVEIEKKAGRDNNVYALKVAELSKFATAENNKSNPSKYFKLKGTDSAENVVIMVFDLRAYQPHLQYEAISFINAIVEDCSAIYDGLLG